MEKIIVSVNDNIKHLPEQILFKLARNESASKEYRKAAVVLLLDMKSPFTENPEIRELVLEIRAEEKAKAEVKDLVTGAIESTL